MRYDIKIIALSPNDKLLLIIDKEGKSSLYHLGKNIIFANFDFKGKVWNSHFSPNGKYFAIAIRSNQHPAIEIWKTPNLEKEFAPFIKLKHFILHNQKITCISWSHDSKFFI